MPYTPPGSPRGTTHPHKEFHPAGGPVRPSITAIIPGPRIQRRGSVVTPTTPSSTTSGTSLPAAPTSLPVATSPPSGRRRNQQTPHGGEGRGSSVDVELVKALKVFFKDMKEVQRQMKSVRKLGRQTLSNGQDPRRDKTELIVLRLHAVLMHLK